MQLESRHRPVSGHPAAERQFVDREEPIAIFQAALKAPQRTKPLVLVFHGGAGTGKSRLRRELVRLVDSRQPVVDSRQQTVDGVAVAATLDFDIPINRQPDAALFFLRKAIGEACKAGFPSFDLAYAVLWQKSHPDAPLGDDLKRLLESGSLLSQLLDESGKLPLIGLIPRIAKLFAATLDPLNPRPLDPFLRTWWTQRGERELEDLPQMEPAAIVECLPRLWAADLKESLVHRSSLIVNRRAVLFIDSYEKLWGTGNGRQETDAWVRELVKQLPEVLWVISGRQKLRWEEVEKEWDDVLSQHELGALPERSTRQFLSSCGITDVPIQDAVVKGSQGLPHYLNLAVDTFLEIKQSGQRVPSTSASSSTSQAETPEEVFAQFIRHLDQPEIATLQVLSASRFWNYGLFEHLVTEYQTGYPLTAYDDLSRFSFVGEGAAPETRTMHELMRDALQEHQAPDLRKRAHLFLHELYAKQLEGLNVKNITDKHKAALTEAFYHGRQAKSTEELWAWFAPVREVVQEAGQYRLVLPLSREMVSVLQIELGPKHASVALALFRLATTLTEQGEYAEAEPLLRRVLPIFEKEHPEDRLLCDCLVWLAKLLRNRGRYDEAEALCRRAVEGFDKPRIEASVRKQALGNLAAVLIDEDKYAEAEEFCRRELEVCEKELGPEHRLTADSLNTLGYLFMQQRRFVEAEPLFRRALAIKEKTVGANHPDVLYPLNNLGMILHWLCRFAEAELLHRRALRIGEGTLGPDHPEMAGWMNNLGTLLRDQGRCAEAELLLRQALALVQKRKGADHPETIMGTGNLVSILVRQGKHAEAEPLVLSAMANSEKRFGSDHPQTAKALHTASVVYRGLGRYSEAEGYLRRALEIRTRVFGPEHQETLYSLFTMGILEEQRGRYAEAESLYRDVLEKRGRILGADHPEVADTAIRLAGSCCRDGRYAEAEVIFRRALAIREKAFGPNSPLVAESLDGLAKVCEQTGRTAEAQELSARAQRIRARAEPAPPDS